MKIENMDQEVVSRIKVLDCENFEITELWEWFCKAKEANTFFHFLPSM